MRTWFAHFPGGGRYRLTGDTLTEAHADLCRRVAEIGAGTVGGLQSTLSGGVTTVSHGTGEYAVRIGGLL